ncbi:MAG TPA: glycosyltransferase [Pyrinomonadaceae bacterium]|nr:glycosyltransferase [Pyrinomonadaceae bacterium]
MTRSFREGLPFHVKLLAKRLLVGAVGALVRAAARSVNFTRRLLDFAVKHGLNLPRAWDVRPRDYHGEPLLPAAFTARDFLLLNEGLKAARASDDESRAGGEIKTSVIIPVFNQVEYTFHCLRSLVSEIDFRETEVIVVDNASRDETRALLAHFEGLVRVIHNDENRGFVDACNQGAAAARGRFLVFLNNDTVVLRDWLAALVETVERDERVGAVGSLFLYPTGMVQEAGSVVWRDGGAHHYGWGGRADDARFAFAREVDYCSGASLLVRRELFERLGGVDRRYAPAYYEDVDLCFGVRALGYGVVYQPASRIVHYEGGTAGRDTSTGFKRYQVTNRAVFVAKWREVLEREHLGQDPARVEEAATRRGGPRFVVFDERVPTPDRDAGSARMFFILRALARRGRVTFVPLTRMYGPEYERRLWREGIETASAVDYKRLVKERKFAAAVFSRPGVADALMEGVRRLSPATKLVFDMVDAYFIRLGREYEQTGDEGAREESARYREMETRLARASDLVWCNSAGDKEAMTRLAPGVPIEVIPTIHELHDGGPAFDGRSGLLFVGNLVHRPNSDAIHYLMREILPHVRAELPGVRLTIVGDNVTPEVAAYESDAVRVAGYVPDAGPFWRGARVVVAPLRFGAGVKGKVGEAMSYGLPVVATSVAAEGFGLTDGTHVLVRDDPREFAAAVVKLYTDEILWRRLADEGRRHIELHYTPERVAEVVGGSIEALGVTLRTRVEGGSR